MKVKIGIYILVSIIVLALLGGIILNVGFKKPETDFTIVQAPEQTQPFVPAFAVSTKEKITPVTGDNLALIKKIDCNAFTDVYPQQNANDGDVKTYWEGAQNKYPNQLTVDLEKPTSVKCVQVKLNPATIWESRKQTFAILVSQDGNSFTPTVESKSYEFDPATGNILIVNFDPVEVRFVRLEFTANTAAKGGQVAEFEIY
jgi:hypothetical protein